MNRSFPALLASALLVVTVTGCASRGARDCASIAGTSFSRLASPPADRSTLLALANLPGEAEVQWFGQGPDRVMVCDPSNSLVNPGCGGSIAYQFERSGDGWASRGLLLPICDDGSGN